MNTKIKTLFLALALVFGIAFSGRAEEPTKEKLKEKPPTENSDRPKAPGALTIYCSVANGALTVWSTSDAIGTVTVSNETTGEVIATDCGMLGDCIMILLPDTWDGNTAQPLRVEVDIDGTIYYTVF